MAHDDNRIPRKRKQPRPTAMAGAGPLTSAIWKSGDERGGWRYRFNVFRQLAGTGHVSQLFQPSDLIHFVKLVQVLAAMLADDGCLPTRQRKLLQHLATDLDEITQHWDLSDDLPDSNERPRPLHKPWQGNHGDSANS